MVVILSFCFCFFCLYYEFLCVFQLLASCVLRKSILRYVEMLIYGVGYKNVALYFCPYLHQLMTDFQYSFPDALCGQFALMWLLYIPPHHKCVSTLPCKIQMKHACITIITNKHSGKIEKKHHCKLSAEWASEMISKNGQ